MSSKLIQWAGGKGRLFPKILPYLNTPHKIYVEPYCGGASIFFEKQPSKNEVINDIDKEIINIYRVLQDPKTYEELKHRLTWTPHSKAEFERALTIIQSDQEQNLVIRAWAFFVGQNQGFSGFDCRTATKGSWARRLYQNSNGFAFFNKVNQLDKFRDRLKHTQIDCTDAITCIKYWDTPETLFYLDPPYIPDTRKDINLYQHECDMKHHEELVQTLLSIKGQAILSAYHHPLYDTLLENGWERKDFQTSCHAIPRTRTNNLKGNGIVSELHPRIETIYIKIKKQDLFSLVEEINSSDTDSESKTLFE